MAHKTPRGGWIAPYSEQDKHPVIERKDGKDKKHYPTGIYVHGRYSVGVWMSYAGIDSSIESFLLPSDTNILRDIAEAIENIADDIDMERGE